MDFPRLSYLPDHSLALWHARLQQFFSKHTDKVYPGKQQIQSPDRGIAAVSFQKTGAFYIYRGNICKQTKNHKKAGLQPTSSLLYVRQLQGF